MGRTLSRSLSLFGVTFGLFLMTALGGGPSVAGKWTGTVDVHDSSSGTDISTPIELQLDEPQAGAISGKIGREGDTEIVPIRKGTLNGNQISFEAASEETTGAMKFTLTLDGDRLAGNMKGALDTQEIQGKVKLSRPAK